MKLIERITEVMGEVRGSLHVDEIAGMFSEKL